MASKPRSRGMCERDGGRRKEKMEEKERVCETMREGESVMSFFFFFLRETVIKNRVLLGLGLNS